MKRIASIIALSLAALIVDASAMGYIKPKPVPPAPPVVTDQIPALPDYSTAAVQLTLTDGTGLLVPFVGSTARGRLVIDGAARTVSGELLEATDQGGQPIEVTPGKYTFAGVPLTVSEDNVTLSARAVKSWGVATITATRTDASNVHLIVTGTIQGQDAIATGAGVLAPANRPTGPPEPPPVVTPDPEPTGEPIDVSKVQWLGRGAPGWPVVVKATGRIDDRIRLTLDGNIGREAWMGIILLRDGQLYGGCVDGVGNNPRNIAKGFGNLTGGSKGGPLIARFGPKSSESASRAYLKLRKGETFWAYVQSEYPKGRTTVVPLVWQQSDPAPTPRPDPGTMPADLPGTGQSGFLWKPAAEGGGGGLVVLFNAKLLPFVVSATINGGNKVKQVPPYEDGRGALRWSGKTFGGAVTLAFQLSDGRELRFAIPNGKVRTERVRPTVYP